MATFDYRIKEIRLVHYAMLSGGIDADLACIQEAYRECRGFKPECASPIDFAVAERRDGKAPLQAVD
jgi:hypothetical protein